MPLPDERARRRATARAERFASATLPLQRNHLAIGEARSVGVFRFELFLNDTIDVGAP